MFALLPTLIPTLLALALRPEVAAADVLREWDERRAAAYAAGDPAALRPLYTPGSAAGRADRAMLRAYADRGLRVTGLRRQLLAVEVLDAGPGWWRLGVTDRLVGGVARGGGQPVVLPRDRPSSWRVQLRRHAGGWRVGVVRARDQAAGWSAAASAASTSRWRNE